MGSSRNRASGAPATATASAAPKKPATRPPLGAGAATGAAAALSGSHTVLSALSAAQAAGTAVPLSFGCYFGIRHYWETGEPVFGLTSSATNGCLLFEYTVDPGNATYTAKFRMSPGSAVPAWGTAAIT